MVLNIGLKALPLRLVNPPDANPLILLCIPGTVLHGCKESTQTRWHIGTTKNKQHLDVRGKNG